MKQTITFSQFCDAFLDMGRENNFSYAGKRALFDFIEQMDEDCGTDTELDVIALCCEFTEYEGLEEFHCDYNAEKYPDRDSIRYHTLFIDIDGESFIVASF